MESKLISEDQMNKIIPEDNADGEMDLHIEKVKKISGWGIKQDRIALLSTHKIYVLKLGTFEVKETVAISELRYIIKCGKSNEILLYFEGHFDLRFIMTNHGDFLDLIKLRFPQFCPRIPLKVFVIDDADNLSAFKTDTRRSKAYAFNNEPDPKYRHKS